MSRGWGQALRSKAVKAAIAADRAAHPRPRGKLSHAPLCGKRAGQPCTCGADARRKGRERELVAALALVGVKPSRLDETFLPGRGFRGDLIFDAARLIVEVQGWAGGYGPHGGIAKAKADVEKHALAAAHGWRVLPVTRDTIRSGEAARLILAALAWEGR